MTLHGSEYNYDLLGYSVSKCIHFTSTRHPSGCIVDQLSTESSLNLHDQPTYY